MYLSSDDAFNSSANNSSNFEGFPSSALQLETILYTLSLRLPYHLVPLLYLYVIPFVC